MNIPQFYELSWSTEILKSTYEYKKNLHSAIADCGFNTLNYTENQSSLGFLGLVDSIEAAFYTGKALVSKVANAFFTTYFGNGDAAKSTQLLAEASKFGYLFANNLANIGTLGFLNKFVMSAEAPETDSPDTTSETDSLSNSDSDDSSIGSNSTQYDDDNVDPDPSIYYDAAENTSYAETSTDTSDLLTTPKISTSSMSACKVAAIAIPSLIVGFALTIPIILELYPPGRITS